MMSQSERADRPSPYHDERDELDEFVRAFEEAYRAEGKADLADFLPPAGHPLYLPVLRELVRVDLEFGWDRGKPRSLDEYRRAFPELAGDRDGLREVAFEEFRLRRQAGESPSPREYLDRFGVILDARGGRFRPTLPAGLGSWAASPSTTGGTRGRFPSEVPGLPAVGEEFAGFRLVGVLGKGSFGRVYLARQGALADRPIVLKVTADRRDEAQTLARLQHANIVPVYSTHQAGPLRAVCMPYLGSVTLRDVFEDLKAMGTLPGSGRGILSSLAKSSVRKRDLESGEAKAAAEPAADSGVWTEPPPSPPQSAEALGVLGALSYVGAVVWMAARLAEGLAHAHERGILHRDMKPANVLLTDDGRPMLLDFNLAADLRRAGDGPEDEGGDSLGGTLAYMSPEHLDAFRGGARPVDERSDLYSFGVILFEMLTGLPPFPARELPRPRLLAAMIDDRLGPTPALRPWNPAVPRAVESIVRRCLEPEPSDRYASARELAEDLTLHLTHRPLKHTPDPSTPAERANRLARRHPRVVVLALALAISTLIAPALAVKVRAGWVESEQAVAAVGRMESRARTAWSLLSTWKKGQGQRERGLNESRAALAEVHALESLAWWDRPPVSRLAGPERDRLRREVGELLLISARGEFEAAADKPDGAARRLAALNLNERAEACYPSGPVPGVLFRQRAEIRLALGDKDAASRLDATADAHPPINPRDRTLAAIDLAHKGRYDEALPLFREAARADDEDFEARFGEGLCQEWLLHHAEAELCYSACVGMRPDDAPSWFNLGVQRMHREELRDAAIAFRHAARLVPDDPEPVASLAIIAHRQGRYRDAIEGLTRALAMPHASSRFYFVRARARRELGDTEGADRDEAEGLRLKPTDEAAWVVRGNAKSLRGDYHGAIADFDEALRLNPRSYFAFQGKAAVLSERLGRQGEAIGCLDRVITLYPHLGIARAERGVLRARLGLEEAARDDAKAALDREPEPPVYYLVGCTFSLLSRHSPDDVPKALQHLRVALERDYLGDLLRDDRDLEPLKGVPDFRRLLDEARDQDVARRASRPPTIPPRRP